MPQDYKTPGRHTSGFGPSGAKHAADYDSRGDFQLDHSQPQNSPTPEYEYRIPAQDQRGHSERAWFRLQPGHSHQVEIILASHLFPYKTTGDIMRHALLRHLRWLVEQQPLPTVLKQVDAILEILVDEQFHHDFDTMFDRTERSVGEHIARGRIGAARELLLRIHQHISDMPDGNWRDRYMEEMERRFGHLLNDQSASMSW